MKKFFTVMAMAALAIGTAMAAWQPSDMEATRLDKEGTNGQVQMKTETTPDGKIVLSWLRPERTGDVFSYQLHLQVFDKQGNPQFGDEGIIVCDKPTRTWTTDYAMTLAPNGDILLAYNDIRNDVEYGEETEVYIYRYNQQGEPVWDADGILFPSWQMNENTFSAEDVAPAICVSGENIYVAAAHTEYFGGSKTWWQVVRLNDDGTIAPAMEKSFESKILVMKPAPEGYVYCIYDNADLGMDGQMLNEILVNMWNDPITVEARQVSNGRFMPTPLTQVDADGGLFLSYRVLLGFTGFQVVNYVTPEGEVLEVAPSLNGSEDGDAGTAAMGIKDDMAMVAWEYDFGSYFMCANVVNAAGDYCWPDENFYGINLDENYTWGFTPVKVIPREDGWVLLYGNSTSWNGANFMVVKIDDVGNTVWVKQICEDNFKSSGFSVAYDDKNAYIFYTQEEEYDQNYQVIEGSGGMFVMCVDIAGKTTAVDEVKAAAQVVETEIYTIDGRRVSELQSGVNILRMTDANGNVTTRKVRK